MAEEKKPPKKGKAAQGKRPMVAFDRELHQKLKEICVRTGVQMQDFVHTHLKPIVEREHARLFRTAGE